jgi:hypothetical protein
VGGDELEEGGDLGLERELRHLDARGRVGADDPVGPGERQLALCLLVRGAGDDRQPGAARSGREGDVHVFRIRVGGREQAFRAVDARAREVLVLGAPAFEEEHAALFRHRNRVRIEVEDDVRLPRDLELLGSPPSHAAVPADDEVVAQLVDHA